MEIRQVRAFIAVAELRHFGRAAERLHVVQPAVSQQIRRLEQELGVQLLHRTTRTVKLTAPGAAFLVQAREIIAAAERAARAAQQVAAASPTLRIGTGAGLGDILGEVLDELRRSRHDLAIELVRLPEHERLRRLVDRRLDVAVARDSRRPLPEGLARTPVLTERLIAALPSSRTTPRRRTVRLDHLAVMPARLPEQTQNPVLLDAIASACERIGVTLRRIPAGADDDMLALIANGPPSWTVFYPSKAELLARRPAPAVAFRQIAAPPISVTTSLLRRIDDRNAAAFAEAFRVIAAAH